MIEIIIPTYNNEEYTKKCFESIRKYTPQDEYRLWWMDNGSTKKSCDFVLPEFNKHKNGVVIWGSENLGFVRGINNVLRLMFDVHKINSEYIILQNNDTVVTENWIEPMRLLLENNSSIGMVSPVTKDNKDVMSKISGLFYELATVTFFCVMIKSKVLKEAGLLDESFGVGLWDDHDYSHRVRKIGYKIGIALKSFVYHYHRTTFKKIYSAEELSKIHRENMSKYKKKYGMR